jgi:chromosome partitioning protein
MQSAKGGTGKTTLATHIAYGLALKGMRILIVDADQQSSTKDWVISRQDTLPFNFVQMHVPTLHRDLPAIAKDYDITVIDGPPRIAMVARSAISVSDLVIIPVQPSPYDLWAISETFDLINEVSMHRPQLKCVFVINRKIANTAISKDVAEALKDYDIPVMESQICQRVCFPESAAVGRVVFEYRQRHYQAASQEMQNLVDEIVEKFVRV